MKHFISEVDPINQIGTCAACGPNTKLKRKYGKHAGGFRCRNKYLETKHGPGETIYLDERTSYTTRQKLELIRKQNGLCAICQQPVIRPHVDHCHTTGTIRGVLCRDCNIGLGNFKDDPELLRRAISYLDA